MADYRNMGDYADAYSAAISSLTAAIHSLGPKERAEHEQLTLYFLSYGLLRLAEGLLEQSREMDIRLAEIADRLPPKQ